MRQFINGKIYDTALAKALSWLKENREYINITDELLNEFSDLIELA